VGADDGFFVFSAEGGKIFSNTMSLIGMEIVLGTNNNVVIASSNGIYTYDENLRNVDKIITDEAVIGVAGLEKAIGYVTPSTFRVVDYNKSIVYEYNIKEGEKILSISGNKNYVGVLTSIADLNMIYAEVRDGEVVLIKKDAIDDIKNSPKSYCVKDGMKIAAFPDNNIEFKNLVAISASEVIAGGEKILKEIKEIGVAEEERRQIENLMEEMRKEFNERNYEKVSKIGENLETKAIAVGDRYVLEEKSQTDYLLEMASEKNMTLTTGTKLRYDNAIEEMFTGNYKSAISDFKGVRTETEQFVRDKVLNVLENVEKRKAALDKFAESTPNITALDEKINSEKDYVNTFTLLDDVKELEDLTKERTKELFDNAEKAKKEAIKPWLLFGADVKDIEEKIQEAHIAEDEKDYEKAVKALSEATKEAKDYDVISKVQDVSVIAIVVGIIVLIVLYIRRPKVKEE